MLNILWVIMMAGGILFASFHGTMGKVTEALIDSSTEAVNLCIFMLGVIGVWNGMMEIAVKSGLMKRIAQVMYPFIHWLFPDIPRGHKANEYIAANMAANILGLGWAATPAGLKAMQELRSLDEGKQKRWTDRKDRRTFLRDSGGKAPAGSGRASDMMCAFLVLNISSLQLIPINMIVSMVRWSRRLSCCHPSYRQPYRRWRGSCLSRRWNKSGKGGGEDENVPLVF